ncbi:MAG TPA: polyketide synthase, partial [Chloroflexota bacterium]|nr:polyketide synthase [Chloroflexota bacterium]
MTRLARYLATAADTGRDGAGPKAALASGTKKVENLGEHSEQIAIVGMACQFPGAPDLASFWRLLRDGGSAVGPVPSDRWSMDQFEGNASTEPGTLNCRAGGFLPRIDQFDPLFFGISPHEAAFMDPQQRLVLETAWAALEGAGLAPDRLAGTATGVYVGIATSDYARLRGDVPEMREFYAATGGSFAIAANRLSYLLDLRGPSLAVDTACSSSLLAVHLACAGLRQGEITTAIVGGVNVILDPEVSVSLAEGGALSTTGACHTFDARADGYVRGEGCGVLILKPLSAARRDGNPILAVIRGTAVNQDGKSNGLTAPNGLAQEAVIGLALRNAGIRPREISYVETHGTGTPLGDPIEVAALQRVLGTDRSGDEPCFLGSVKANIGHLEAAAGVAGLIKTVLALRHGEIPCQPTFRTLNPAIDLAGSALVIPTSRVAWPAGPIPRRAGVSGFGFGGANVHVIVEEAPRVSAQSAGANMLDHRWQGLLLSAPDAERLRLQCAALAE